MANLALGLHEQVVTLALGEALARQPELAGDVSGVDPVDAPHHLARHLSQLLSKVLRGVGDVDGQVALANQLIDVLVAAGPAGAVAAADRVTPALLRALARRDALAGVDFPPRPDTPLTQTHLLLNARGEPSIGHQLVGEIASADRVDLLCSFLMWSGYQKLQGALQDLLTRRRRPLRVLTTVYCGATERRVLDALHALGAQIKVSYDTRRTRLHAKAWLLHRESGCSTAFIGSSNLSAAALSDGLEWNVRVGIDAEDVLKKFAAAFEGYWSDPAFEDYEPARDAARFDAAVRGERRESDGAADAVYAAIDVRPFPFQERILEQLEVERRVHGRWKNLVVAATGTGKTVIAALDFRRVRASLPARPRLLFVAHRKEILTQSRSVFRQVLREPTFGGLLVDGERPLPGQDVFASVQSLARVDLQNVDPQAWDVVIVDEFHHAEASTYTRILAHLRPRLLVGLTATPERADGGDVTRWFDGHIAAELRLWEAIDRGLLVPFQYFGLRDPVDASPHWRRGRVDAEALDRVYSGHDVRANQILQAVADHVLDPRRMRALGFCVGVAHARFMARRFEEAGLPARALVGGDREREQVLRDFREGRLCALFTVDLLNEGVDIPEIDTVLFLRPTESATVFLQQLGRGLRLCDGKRYLTVLDFIATADRAFRFDLRYRALLGTTRSGLAQQVEAGFPVLPAGCAITLAPDAAQVVLDNLQHALSPRRDRLVAELRSLGADITLAGFLEHANLELPEVYNRRSFTELRREAGFPMPPAGPEEARLSLSIGRLLHVDDPFAIDRLVGALRQDAPQPLDPVVLTTLLDEAVVDPAAAARILWANPAIRHELVELLALLRVGVAHVPIPLGHPRVPLSLHCRYRLEQVMAAFGAVKDGKLHRPREGVWFDPATGADVFFVTLQKAEKDYSPSTLYEDYALSRDRFHWQTQSATTPTSERGRRNLEHRERGITPLLFVRSQKRDERGDTVPYTFLGPLEIERWQGEKPISIVWRLLHPMPADVFESARVAG